MGSELIVCAYFFFLFYLFFFCQILTNAQMKTYTTVRTSFTSVSTLVDRTNVNATATSTLLTENAKVISKLVN